MNSDFITRHRMFIAELRRTALKVELSESHKTKIVRSSIISDEESARIQEELEAKFNELFGNLDDSN